MKFKIITVLLVFAALIQFAQAQDKPIPADLKSLVEQSFSNYPKVESMSQLVQMSEVQVELGKDGYLPVVTGNLNYKRIYPTPSMTLPLPNIPPVNIQFTPASNYNAQIDVVQPLIDFNTATRIGKAKSNLTASKDNLESFKTQLAYQIAQVYYSIIFLNKSIEVQAQQMDLLKASLHQIKVKIQNGSALKYDLLSTQVQYTNTENYYTDLQNQLSKQYNTLNMLTGHSDHNYITDTAIDLQIFDLASDSILAIAKTNNPDIKIAKDKIETARWDVLSANRLRLPTMNLNAGGGFKNGYVPHIETSKFNYYVGLGITIPILPSSRPAKQKQIASISLNTNKLELETQTKTLTNNVLNALEDVQKNDKKLATCDDLVEQAHTALDLATQRYKEGVNTNLDLLTAQTNYQNALLCKLQFGYNLIISKMQVSQLAGFKWW